MNYQRVELCASAGKTVLRDLDLAHWFICRSLRNVETWYTNWLLPPSPNMAFLNQNEVFVSVLRRILNSSHILCPLSLPSQKVRSFPLEQASLLTSTGLGIQAHVSSGRWADSLVGHLAMCSPIAQSGFSRSWNHGLRNKEDGVDHIRVQNHQRPSLGEEQRS